MNNWTLDTLRAEEFLNTPAAAFLRALVRSRQSIAITGRTGTGKSTLLNACLAECDPHDSVTVCENTSELERFSTHWTYALADRMDIAHVVRDVLRRRPNRLVVGEIRDAAMYAVLDNGKTSNPPGCMFTLSVDDPAQAAPYPGVQTPIQDLVRLATPFLISPLPAAFIARRMAAGLDFVATVGKVWSECPGYRNEPAWRYRLLGISEVCGVEDQTIDLHAIFQFDPDTLQAVWTGSIPRRLKAIERACPDFDFRREVESA